MQITPPSSKPYPDFTALGAFWSEDSPRLLERALLSINDNSLLPSEIILVQDGEVSPDLSAVIEKYRGEVPLMLLRLPDNSGLGRALNLGLDSVSTDFVIRFDADDFSLPSRFMTTMKALNAGYDLVGAQVLEKNEPKAPNTIRRVPLCASGIRRLLPYRSPLNHMTVGFRASTIQRVGGYPDIRQREDYGLWLRLIASRSSVINIDEILVEARTGDDFMQRRGGYRNVIAEYKLRKLAVSLGIQTLMPATIIGTLRGIVFLLPSAMRKYIYFWILRTRR